MKKKILYLRTDIYEKPLIAGGSVSHTVGIINGFLKLNYTVAVASTILQEELASRVHTFYQLKNPRTLAFLKTKINSLLSNVFFTSSVIKIIKEELPDFLYQRYSILNCTGIIVSKLKKIPLILEYNGSEVWVEKYWSSKKRLRFFLSPLIRWAEYINLRYATVIVVISSALQQELIARKIKTKILIVPNGVDVDIFDPIALAPSRKAIRSQLQIGNKFVIGFIGTFSIWHGINIIKDIIPILVVQHPNIHFLLIGDGPLLHTLRELISQKDSLGNSVTLTGSLPPSIATEYLAGCDAFLSPTQPNTDGTTFFGSPTKLFEYLSLAKPVIASNIGQMTEIIEPMSNGLLANPLSAQEFVAAVQTLLRLSDEDRMQIGKNARATVIERYQWHQQVKRIMETMEHYG